MRFLDADLRQVLEYVGPHHYRFLSRQWERQYRADHGRKKITNWDAVTSSLSRLLLYKQEDENPSAKRASTRDKKIGQSENLRMMQWLLAHNRLALSTSLIEGAALGGHLKVLKWLRTNGCPWDEKTCSNAAKGGHLLVLKWARSNKCPWNAATCSYAAQRGYLEVLKWARANGCRWDERTCSLATLCGHLEILKWARANGCQWDSDECLDFARRYNEGETAREIVQWILALP